MDTQQQSLKVAMAQIAPVWLDKSKTLVKILEAIDNAGNQKCDLVVFGEGLLPGYPFWLSMTGASEFNNTNQKDIHAHYVQNAVQIEAGDLDDICKMAASHNIAVYLGIIERAMDRGGHSLYCTLVYIDKSGEIKSTHRKLQPTYEERLSWSPGDGHGLQVHGIGDFRLGGLNCWENWMPLVRSSLYAMGENVHIAVWPGCERNTKDITRYIAQESRSYVISVSGLMRKSDFPSHTPHLDMIIDGADEMISNGGSCIAAPDGTWLISPVIDKEDIIIAELDYNQILRERHNFDPSGHYSRPDITKLNVDRRRQSIISIRD